MTVGIAGLLGKAMVGVEITVGGRVAVALAVGVKVGNGVAVAVVVGVAVGVAVGFRRTLKDRVCQRLHIRSEQDCDWIV